MSEVYFVRQIGTQGPVKIGCSVDVVNRLAQLSVWSPVKLEVVTTIQGSIREERRFHSAFWSDHNHHEWFKWSQRLQDTMDSIVAGTFDLESMLPPYKTRKRDKKYNTKWTPEKRAEVKIKNAFNKLRSETGMDLPFPHFPYQAFLENGVEAKKAVVAFLSDPKTGVTIAERKRQEDIHLANIRLEKAQDILKGTNIVISFPPIEARVSRKQAAA